MKTLVLFCLVVFSFKALGQSTVCTEVNITNPVIRRIIVDYYSDCIVKNFFRENIGVVELTDYTDSVGYRRINLRALIDDRYKDAPPNQYSNVDGQLVLLYKGNTKGNKQSETITPELLDCLSIAIGKQLYIRPLQQPDRYFEVKTVDGKVKKIRGGNSVQGGNVWNEVTYIFTSPTKYSTIRPM